MRRGPQTNFVRDHNGKVVNGLSHIGWISLPIGILSLICSRAYYAFFFLPQHHGSFLQAAKHLIDFEGGWAYVRSVPGMVFYGVAFLSFLVFGVSILTAWRTDSASSHGSD